MKRTLVLLSAISFGALGLTFAACSSDDSGAGSGNPDSGDTFDSGTTPVVDSGSGALDSSTSVAVDSGKQGDSGNTAVDSGKQGDSGNTAVDSGKQGDSGNTAVDSGTVVDSGTLVDSGHAVDSGTPVDSGAADSAAAVDSGEDAGDAAPACVTLTVKNVPLGTPWCNVTVNGGAVSSAATQTACVAPGTSVALTATPHSGFELGPNPWHDTAGDLDGGGELGTPAGDTTVVVSGTKCVWVCCPFDPSGTGCPTTDQCP